MSSHAPSAIDRPPPTPRAGRWRHALALVRALGRVEGAAPGPLAPPGACRHPRCTPAFDPRDAALPVEVVARRWPPFHGRCPDCGARVTAYASVEHVVALDA